MQQRGFAGAGLAGDQCVMLRAAAASAEYHFYDCVCTFDAEWDCDLIMIPGEPVVAVVNIKIIHIFEIFFCSRSTIDLGADLLENCGLVGHDVTHVV